MVIRWLNPYGTDWHYVVSLPHNAMWTTESLQDAISIVAQYNLTSEAIAFCEKK